MKNIFSFLIICFTLIILNGCSTVSSENKVNQLYENPISPNYLDFIKVYKNDSNIYIQYLFKDKTGFFVGNIEDLKRNRFYDRNIYGNRIVKLSNYYSENEDDEDQFSNLKINPKFKELNIIKQKDLSEIMKPILEDVFPKIFPKNPNEAIMLSIQKEDFVLYEDENGIFHSEKIEDKPSNIVVIKAYKEQDLYDLIFAEIRKNEFITSKAINGFVIFETGFTHADSLYTLADINNSTMYYFDYDILYDFKKVSMELKYLIMLSGSAVVKSHILEPIKSPVTSFQNLFSMLYQNVKKIVVDPKPKVYDNIPPLYEGEPMDLANFNKKLDKKVGKDIYKGSIKYLINGDDFFGDFITETENAKESVDVRLYIFDTDDYAVRVADILKAKSNNDKKVKVKVLIDGIANITEGMEKPDLPMDKNFKSPTSIKAYLRKGSKVKVKTSSNTWFIFDHSKMIVIDNKIAYVGGMNIGQEYRYSWHDMMMRLEGPVTSAVQKEFNKAWASASMAGDLGKLFAVVFNTAKHTEEEKAEYQDKLKDMVDIRLLFTKANRPEIYKAQMLAIKNAKKYIYIENPYLADYRIITALIEARQRGVDVRVILPSKNNVGMMVSSNAIVTNLFLKNGIRVFSYPGMTHIKAAIYDGWASVGSANFDNLSLAINKEFNIAFDDKRLVDELKERLFEEDFRISKEITELVKTDWTDKVLSHFANKF